uniref:Uncharacterized protein n=1 Tax=Rhizophora mucronata TaxID=61149 RepID=A0A2P2N7Y4_RHIMU
MVFSFDIMPFRN